MLLPPAFMHYLPAFLGTVKGEFKKRFYNHKQSFKNQFYPKDTSLSKYIWEIKNNHHITPAMT